MLQKGKHDSFCEFVLCIAASTIKISQKMYEKFFPLRVQKSAVECVYLTQLLNLARHNLFTIDSV